MDKKMINKEEIIAEYLTGNISYRVLDKKHGVPSRSICDWVMK
jgi:transposase-like protein